MPSIAVSAQNADSCSFEENGIADLVGLVGRSAPDQYSPDLSLFVLDAGIRLLETRPLDLIYLSLSDLVQHKHAPEAPEALEFMSAVDTRLGQLLEMGVTLGIVADHGMTDLAREDGEPNVLYIGDILDEEFGIGATKVICPISDPFVRHHGSLGGFVRVHVMVDWLSQLQRLAAAMAFAAGPKLVVFDEPTTALDVTTQIGVLHAFRETLRKSRAAAIYITHDLAVVAQVADRIIVLADGKIVEEGRTDQILEAPRHHLTKILLKASKAAQPSSALRRTLREDAVPLLTLQSVSAAYRHSSKPIISDVSLQIKKGEIVAVVGESGSGKSTLARAIAGLAPHVEGSITWRGEPLGSLDRRRRQSLRQIQLVMQSADTALNPRQRVEDILSRPLKLFGLCAADTFSERNIQLLERVRLPRQVMRRFSGELSGGQKQRLNLARALAAEPDLVLCDEVTSALDVVTRLEIVELLRNIRDQSGTSFLFITHDLLTAANLADRIIVMRNGVIVEEGLSDDVMSRPREMYTKNLINSIPLAQKGWLDHAIHLQHEMHCSGNPQVPGSVPVWHQNNEMAVP